MKKKGLTGLLILIGGFLLFFIFRFIYGYVSYPDITENRQNTYFQNDINQTMNNEQKALSIRKNYASLKQKSTVKDTVTIDQKYEKKATLNAYSGKFAEDVKTLKDLITTDNALVQYEDQSGLEGQRRLYLSIGVPPENFDRFVEEIKKIGRLNYIQINKNDKTNEYKELNAKMNSLVKSRDALIKLKSMQAKVEELIQLEEKILVIENQIQDLGVNLGQYDEVNEFCTVDFTLYENILKGNRIGILQRIMVALEWSIKYYFIFIITLLFGALLLLIIFKFLEKLKVFKTILEKLDQK